MESLFMKNVVITLDLLSRLCIGLAVSPEYLTLLTLWPWNWTFK